MTQEKPTHAFKATIVPRGAPPPSVTKPADYKEPADGETRQPCICGGKGLGASGFHFPGSPGCKLPRAPDGKLMGPTKIMVGAQRATAQWGVIGKTDKGTRVAIDLSGCNTVALFGVQGFGKSYTLGVIAENAVLDMPGLNVLPKPLATVVFHYHRSEAYEPELLSAMRINRKLGEVKELSDVYNAVPTKLDDVVLLVPESKVERRRRQYGELGVRVEPIKFHPTELKGMGWKILLGAYGNDALYLRQLSSIMGRLRDDLSLVALKREILGAQLDTAVERLALNRLKLAEPYLLAEEEDGTPSDETQKGVGALLQAGRTIVVDLRDAWIEKDQALELFVVLMNVFGAAGRDEEGHTSFNRLMVLDEAHKYVSEPELVDHLVETVREMRHLGTTVVVASQDPPSIPRTVLELSTVVVCHRMTSPQWVKHLRSAIFALEDLTERELANLGPGEAFVWAQLSTDKRFSQKPQWMSVRPRATEHGGGTKTAVRED